MGKGQMWPLFTTTAAYAMNTFASEALSSLSPFQLVFLRDLPDLTSLSFHKIDTIPVKHREYYNLLLARAQLVGNLLLEWRTKQTLEYENGAKKFRNMQTTENWFSPLAMQDAFCLVCWFSCSFVSEACACFGEWL